MKLPLEIIFRDLVPLPSLEPDIRRRAAKLEQFVPTLMSCRVVVEASANRHRQGHSYAVKIDVRVPSDELFVGEHHRSEDIEVAVREAFDAMGRRLEDYARRRRGQVKHHGTNAPPAEGDAAGDDEGAKQ